MSDGPPNFYPRLAKLELRPGHIPRTWTREQWRRVHRWLRQSQRVIREEMAKKERGV